jgi:hypothetical protein
LLKSAKLASCVNILASHGFDDALAAAAAEASGYDADQAVLLLSSDGVVDGHGGVLPIEVAR